MKTKEDVKVSIEKIFMDYSTKDSYDLNNAIGDMLNLMNEYKYSDSGIKMKDKAISKIIINHINAGNLNLNNICVNDLVKDIISELAVLEQEPTVMEQIREATAFILTGKECY